MMATVGSKRKRSSYPPPERSTPYSHHPVHSAYVGWNDGKIWSCKSGRYVEGSLLNGYITIKIEDKCTRKHRFSFEIANQRVILKGMEIDHINGDKKDNSWSNLQELNRADHMAKTRADNPLMAKRHSNPDV